MLMLTLLLVIVDVEDVVEDDVFVDADVDISVIVDVEDNVVFADYCGTCRLIS